MYTPLRHPELVSGSSEDVDHAAEGDSMTYANKALISKQSLRVVLLPQTR